MLSATITKAVDSTNAVTLTEGELQRAALIVLVSDNPAPTGAITVTLPGFQRGSFGLRNSTLQNATITVASQAITAPVVNVGQSAILFLDDNAVSSVSGGAQTTLTIQTGTQAIGKVFGRGQTKAKQTD